MGNIDWLPIADMPGTLKDGREVLTGWVDTDRIDIGRCEAGRWYGSENVEYKALPTHFAEINPPEASMPGFPQ